MAVGTCLLWLMCSINRSYNSKQSKSKSTRHEAACQVGVSRCTSRSRMIVAAAALIYVRSAFISTPWGIYIYTYVHIDTGNRVSSGIHKTPKGQAERRTSSCLRWRKRDCRYLCVRMCICIFPWGANKSATYI